MQNLNSMFISPNNSGSLILKRVRMYLGLTQTELSKRISVSNQTISAWECGKREIPLEDLRNIFKTFDLEFKDFVELAPTPPDYTRILYCKVCGSVHINTYPGDFMCCGQKSSQINNLDKISCPCLISEKNETVYVTLDTSSYRNHYVKYFAYISENGAEIAYTPTNSMPQATFKTRDNSKLYAFRNGLGLFELK